MSRRILRVLALWSLVGPQTGTFAGQDDPLKAELPTPVRNRVDFVGQIEPILREKCLSCHSKGKYKGGLSLETRAELLKGGEEGPSVVIGKSGDSLMVRMIAGHEEGRLMPQKGKPLSANDVALVRGWIDQGLNWPDTISFGFRRAPVEPRHPQVPGPQASPSFENPIDRFIARDAGPSLNWSPISDREFARRAWLDLTGLLPPPERLSRFIADTRSDKRSRLVSELLADRETYAEHWLSFWNDALRNAYRGTGFIDGGRKTITEWLFRSLYDNKPYDQFVRELISPVAGSEGFIKGIVWRGVVNASQVPPVQAAQNLTQVFLGSNLKCASCHDSFVNHWKLTDAYALASVFAEKPLEIHRCDKPTGETSAVGFIYPSLGTINANAPRETRLKQLAEILVSPKNGRFSRTIVNRLWAQLMGRGLVEPLDDLDQPSWNPDLLDWLAGDFVAHGHDVKHTLALIASSRAYQLPSVGLPEPSESSAFAFRGPFTKRMTAEQYADALSSVTGVWPAASGEMNAVDGRGQGGQLAAVRGAVARASRRGPDPAPNHEKIAAGWVWSHADATNDPGGTAYFRKVFRIDSLPERAVVAATCDNQVEVYLNGRRVASTDDWNRPAAADVTQSLRVGENVLAAKATNWPDRKNRKGLQVQGANPAALMVWVGGFKSHDVQWSFGTDDSWICTADAPKNWNQPGLKTSGWTHAVELPNAPGLYGKVDFAAAVRNAGRPAATDPSHLRAALTFDDPLLAALGRTNREQVVTRRDSVATTLQALELNNGSVLDAKLRKGAERWLASENADPLAVLNGVYRDALGRSPTSIERDAALELIGKPARAEGVYDFLWVVAMLPEFQLIR